MGLRIWIDDRRPMPEGYDVRCKWFSEFQQFLKGFRTAVEVGSEERISHVSFDYVLLDDPSWPRPYEKHGDACVELFSMYSRLHAEDVTVEFHSTDPEFNVKMQRVWDDSRSWR